ncbi:MAG TPA: chemotaxis protein CheW [Stellaceae bacterium]|nr:chemotaxis protein CheW [Stellaceae bacterium]
MSLYLQIVIGAGHYLLDARPIVEILPDFRPGADDAHGTEDPAPVIDLRRLFDERADAPGCCIMLTQASGMAAALICDRVVGLTEFGDAEFSPLPPIGPLGMMIDAVATRLAEQRPLLRLRGERAVAAAAAVG